VKILDDLLAVDLQIPALNFIKALASIVPSHSKPVF